MSSTVLGGAELPFLAFLSPEKGEAVPEDPGVQWGESSAPAGSLEGKVQGKHSRSAGITALPVPGTGEGEISPGKPGARDLGTELGVELAFGLEFSTGRILPSAQQLRVFGLFCDNLSALPGRNSPAKGFYSPAHPLFRFYPQVLSSLLTEVFCLLHFMKLSFYIFILCFLLKCLMSRENLYIMCV